MILYKNLMYNSYLIIFGLFFLTNISSAIMEKESNEQNKSIRLSKSNILDTRTLNKLKKIVTKIVVIKKKKKLTTLSTTKTTLHGGVLKSCGISNNSNLFFSIMNGYRADPSSWPWIVSLRLIYPDSILYRCAGTIISKQHVITAAHCFASTDASRFIFVTGSVNLNEKVNPSDILLIEKIFIHQLYDPVNSLNDIAVAKLSKPIELSEKLYPICLPEKTDWKNLFNKNVSVTGWGSTSGFNGFSELSNEMLGAKLFVISDTNCSLMYNINPSYYCAIDLSSVKSQVCFGDSGTGLVYFELETKRWFLYGVANYVLRDPQIVGKCNNNAPSLHAIVPQYMSWIQLHMSL